MTGPQHHQPSLWPSVWTTCLSSFLFGYSLSSLNQPLSAGAQGSASACYNGTDPTCPPGSLLRDINLDATGQEVAQGALILGAWAGSLLAGRFSSHWGPRATLLRLDLLFCAGAAASSLPHAAALVAGRAALGVAVGFEAAIVPVLLSEIAPADIRGRVVGCHQLAITIGIAAAGGLGAALANVHHGWRWLQAAIAAPAVLQVLLAAWVPESPRHAARCRGRAAVTAALVRHDGAAAAAAAIGDDEGGGGGGGSGGDEFDVELAEEVTRGTSGDSGDVDGGGKGEEDGTWGEVFARRGMVITGTGIMALSALTGINSVMLYSTAVFALAGISRATLVTAVVATVNVGATMVGQRLADTSGRRALLLRGIAAMALSLTALAAALLGLARWPTLQGALAATACLAFICGYAVGFGCVGWTVISELVPSRLRTKAYGLFVSANWASNLVVSSFTLSAIDALGGGARGVSHLYLIFAAVSVCAFVFVHRRVRETMGVALEDLHSDFEGDEEHGGGGKHGGGGDVSYARLSGHGRHEGGGGGEGGAAEVEVVRGGGTSGSGRGGDGSASPRRRRSASPRSVAVG